MQQVGGSIGAAALSTIALSATATYLIGHDTGPQAQAVAATYGYTTAFAVSAGLLGLGCILAIVLLPSRSSADKPVFGTSRSRPNFFQQSAPRASAENLFRDTGPRRRLADIGEAGAATPAAPGPPSELAPPATASAQQQVSEAIPVALCSCSPLVHPVAGSSREPGIHPARQDFRPRPGAGT